MKIGNRIKKIRKELDMTQTEFAARIGSTQNSITRYENSQRTPVSTVIALICKEFNVNEEWLRTGNGEMFNAAPTRILDELAYEYKLSKADYVMVEKFVSLRPEIRNGIFDLFREVSMAISDDNIKKDQKISKTIEELEDEYKKSRSNMVQNTESSASNTTLNTDKEINKVSNQ